MQGVEGALDVVDDDPPPCDVRAAFMDATGTFLHHGHAGGMEVYAVVESGLKAVQSVEVEGFIGEDGGTAAYELVDNPAAPHHVATLAAFGNATWQDADGNCRFIAARPGTLDVDAFCRNSAFSATLARRPDATSLIAKDYVANWQADRFNNHIPEFSSEALAASPDGRHAYIYSEGDILIFERIGNRPPAESTDTKQRIDGNNVLAHNTVHHNSRIYRQ